MLCAGKGRVNAISASPTADWTDMIWGSEDSSVGSHGRIADPCDCSSHSVAQLNLNRLSFPDFIGAELAKEGFRNQPPFSPWPEAGADEPFAQFGLAGTLSRLGSEVGAEPL